MEANLKYMENNVKKFEYYEKKLYNENKKLKITQVNNGIVLPPIKQADDISLFGKGGVVNSSGVYISTSAQYGHNMKNRVIGKYEPDKNIEYVDEEVIYFNYFIHQWGHFLIDDISRLWIILEKKYKNHKIVYTCKKDDNISGNYLELLKLIGVDENQLIKIEKPTKFKNVIIADSSLYPGKNYNKYYKKIIEKILSNIEKPKIVYEKVYLSRKHMKTNTRIKFKKELGEHDIENFFNKNNYISVFPEELSLIQQLQIYKYSKEIVATSGSLAHNVVFCKNKFYIINKSATINFHQPLLNQISDADIYYIDANYSLFPISYGYGPFLYNITKSLKQFALDNNMQLDISIKYHLKNIYYKIWYFTMYFIIYKVFKKENEGENQ